MLFDLYPDMYKRHKISRSDLILFRDDLPGQKIFDYVSTVSSLTRRNGDTWWGILAFKCNEKSEESWNKLGCRYYGHATDVTGLRPLLHLLLDKPANYERYTRSKHI